MKNVFGCLALGMLPIAVAAQEPEYEGELVLAHTEVQFAPKAATPQRAAQDGEVYELNSWKIDAPVTAAGTIWTLYAFSRIYDKSPSTEAEIAALSKDDINGFDRWAAGKNDEVAEDNSDYLFYGSIPVPFLLLADKHIRKDAAKVGFLYLESMAITGMLYTGSTYFTNRYRPETYDENLSVGERVDGNYKNSFFAGHVALVGTATFFTAKVFNDYHPESKLRWVLWGGAVAATGTTAYLRHVAGKHFPSDILIGTAVGALSGILVPHLHKVKNPDEQSWSLSPSMDPYSGGYGFSLRYKIK